jgi:hypothetical protein
MRRDERGAEPPSEGGSRPVWLQIGIGLVMGAAVLTALYVLFDQL